ncbi:MAG: hypothetical protein JSS02_28790 [Planctomycetes bacterium]|nr:hypothetical protein [Planctomycetota bacterium]
MEDAISRWWTSFTSQVPRINALFAGEEDWDLPGWMDTHLQQGVNAELMWEFGPACEGDGHRLVITPEVRRDLRPLVREIIRRAPAIPGWEFYEYRLPETFEQAADTVEARVGGDLSSLQVTATAGDFNCIDLRVLGFPPGTDPEQASNMAFVASEALLGEEIFDHWIGLFDTVDSVPEGQTAFPIAELRDRVTALIKTIQTEKMPDRPWYQIDTAEGAPWSVLELDSEPVDDCYGQEDILIAVTLCPELVENTHSNFSFFSGRFSRCGETFCYLKIDGSDGLDDSKFGDRTEIEDALNSVLRPAKLGTNIGGGTGHRYSYIELALTDVDAAWQKIQQVLREGQVPVRTWLQFHDDELAGQWRGLYDQTPAPLLPDFGKTD